MFTLAICCFIKFNLPWFMDLTFWVPMRYCSLQPWTLTMRHIHDWASFLLWLSLFIPSGSFSYCPLPFLSSILDPFWPFCSSLFTYEVHVILWHFLGSFPLLFQPNLVSCPLSSCPQLPAILNTSSFLNMPLLVFFMPYFCLKFSDPPIVPSLSRKLFPQRYYSVVIFLKYQWHFLCAYSAYILGTEAVVSELPVYVSYSLKISFQVGCERWYLG